MEENTVLLQTALGTLRGLDRSEHLVFLGIPFAHAGRFEYAVPVEHWDGVRDAAAFGPGCPQNRAVHEHLEHPTRRFYKREFRSREYRYDEDCLNLNLYTPKKAKGCPVIIYFYGGGFDSGLNCEDPFDGAALARQGIVTVFPNYRVGPLGWLCHDEIRKQTGRDGNFGLDDMLCAIRWVREHISDFGGDPENITLMGQSAGAMSIQYLCLNPENRGLFRRAIMLSGAGLFPKFSLPRRAEENHEYWEQFIGEAGCRDLEELRRLDLHALFETVERMKVLRKDNTYHNMPVVDGLLIPAPVEELMAHPLPLDYWIGCTNNDMYAPILAYIGRRFARQVGGWMYFFDLNAPGDDNRAFHSADLRYVFGTLEGSWRPYGDRDREASEQLISYLANFARRGDPNGPGLPDWRKQGVLHIGPAGTAMGHLDYLKLTMNFLTKGDPKG